MHQGARGTRHTDVPRQHPASRGRKHGVQALLYKLFCKQRRRGNVARRREAKKAEAEAEAEAEARLGLSDEGCDPVVRVQWIEARLRDGQVSSTSTGNLPGEK